MYNRTYTNFVKPSSEFSNSSNINIERVPLSGEEARKLYLNEIQHTRVVDSHDRSSDKHSECSSHRTKSKRLEISDKDLFLYVQNDDVDSLKLALDTSPDKLHKCDGYGWSLLMIACQANSVESVKELLKRGVNTSVRDRAGNSAQSLVIKNKNFTLADILLSNDWDKEAKKKKKKKSDEKIEEYFCDICKIKASQRKYHLSSTIHNINLSKDKKVPTNYAIPETNRGFQIMLKVGWDKDSGLGPEGSGKRYPIKTVQKLDRKGLGLSKKMDTITDNVRHKNRRTLARDHKSNREMEINFRRQFY